MEHEIMGHTKKAIKAMQNHNKSFGEKVKEVLTEIAIIIFAVSFAAFIERTREHYKEQSEAKEFLIGLSQDIKHEIDQVKQSKNAMNQVVKSYTTLIHYNKRSLDSLENTHKRQSFGIPEFNSRPLNGRYEGFKASGRIQTIENDSLRNNILKLYQEDIPFIDFSENAFNGNQLRLQEVLYNGQGDDAADDNPLRTIITPRGKLALTFSISYSTGVLAGYDRMIKQGEKVREEIKQEYGE